MTNIVIIPNTKTTCHNNFQVIIVLKKNKYIYTDKTINFKNKESEISSSVINFLFIEAVQYIIK